MNEDHISTELEEEEDPRVERYRTAILDVRYILETYRVDCPNEAWDTIRKIVFDKKLRINNL